MYTRTYLFSLPVFFHARSSTPTYWLYIFLSTKVPYVCCNEFIGYLLPRTILLLDSGLRQRFLLELIFLAAGRLISIRPRFMKRNGCLTWLGDRMQIHSCPTCYLEINPSKLSRALLIQQGLQYVMTPLIQRQLMASKALQRTPSLSHDKTNIRRFRLATIVRMAIPEQYAYYFSTQVWVGPEINL